MPRIAKSFRGYLEVIGLPIYEYECSECSTRFELRRSFNDESEVFCPDCKCVATRIFSPVPIIFKGSGFYVTDHRSNHGHSTPTGTSEDSKSSDSSQSRPKDTTTSTTTSDK
jgi:putative FmdB family regulatory protein